MAVEGDVRMDNAAYGGIVVRETTKSRMWR